MTTKTEKVSSYKKTSVREFVRKFNDKIFKGAYCPKCKYEMKFSPLVLRKGRYGSFEGCSRYPDCKFTRST